MSRARHSRTKGNSAENVAAPIKTSRPARELHAISNNFDGNILPEVQTFLANPPESSKAKSYELEKLSQKILTQVVLELDRIETDNGELRDKRKECVKRANFWLDRLAIAGDELWIRKVDDSKKRTAESAASDKLR